MQEVSLDEAKTHLSELIEAAVAGEDVFITRDAQSSVQLVPHVVRLRKRQFGSARGLIQIAPDFDELPDDLEVA